MIAREVMLAREREHPNEIEEYDLPVPFVVEVWSPSTGGYDVTTKLPEYQARGDGEIWFLQPYERQVTVWRRQPDGSYTEGTYGAGQIALHAIPEITIDLDLLLG